MTQSISTPAFRADMWRREKERLKRIQLNCLRYGWISNQRTKFEYSYSVKTISLILDGNLLPIGGERSLRETTIKYCNVIGPTVMCFDKYWYHVAMYLLFMFMLSIRHRRHCRSYYRRCPSKLGHLPLWYIYHAHLSYPLHIFLFLHDIPVHSHHHRRPY